MTERQQSLNIATTPEEALKGVEQIASGESNELLLVQLNSGIISFSDIAFRGIAATNILAQKEAREDTGKGPHFDAYKDLLSEQHPYIAHFNLSGEASIHTVPLPEEYAEIYWKEFPEPTGPAYEARRHFGSLALLSAGESELSGTIKPGTGFILPQNHNKPVVHDVKPKTITKPGEFIKLLIPADDKKARARLADQGYMDLDTLLTQSLSGAVVEPAKVVYSRRSAFPQHPRREMRAD